MKHYMLIADPDRSIGTSKHNGSTIREAHRAAHRWGLSWSGFARFIRVFSIYVFIAGVLAIITSVILGSFTLFAILVGSIILFRWGGSRIGQLWRLRCQRVNLLQQNKQHAQEWRNHILLARWRQERSINKTSSCPLPFVYENSDYSPSSIRDVRHEMIYHYPKPPVLTRRVIQHRTPVKILTVGALMVVLFALQIFISLPGVSDIFARNIPQVNDAPEGTTGWLAITQTDIMGSPDANPYFTAFVGNQSYILYETLDGAQGVDYCGIYLGNGVDDPKLLKGDIGFNSYFYKFPTVVWDETGPAAMDPQPPYWNITIPNEFKDHLKWVSIQPAVLAEGYGIVGPDTPLQKQFSGAGPVAVILSSNMSFPDLSVTIDSVELKESDWGSQPNVTCPLVASLVQNNPDLYFTTYLDASPQHTLSIGGNGEVDFIVITNLDADADGLGDLEEFKNWQSNYFRPFTPDAYGTFIQYDLFNESSLEEDIGLGGHWQTMALRLTVPTVFSDAHIFDGNDLVATVTSGTFTNFSIDGDMDLLYNLTLSGYAGDSRQYIDLGEGYECSGPIWGEDLFYVEQHPLGSISAGDHVISWEAWVDTFTEPKIEFTLSGEPVKILGIQAEPSPFADSDGDGLLDANGEDLSPLDTLICEEGTITRLVMPYMKSGEDADVRVDLYFKPPAKDYSTDAGEPVDWHGADTYDPFDPYHREYDEQGHLLCIIQPALRVIGPGSATGVEKDFWNSKAELEAFWQKPVVTYSTVAGFNADSAEGDCLPVIYDADEYYTIVYPQKGNRTWAFSLQWPSNSRALQDNVLVLDFELVWVVVSTDPVDSTTTLQHIYSFTEDTVLQAAIQEEVFDASVIYGTPNNFIESQALWSIAQNPDVQGREQFAGRIIAEAYDVPYYPQMDIVPDYYYDAGNGGDPSIIPPGVGMTERAARMSHIFENDTFKKSSVAPYDLWPWGWEKIGYGISNPEYDSGYGQELFANKFGRDHVLQITDCQLPNAMTGVRRQFGDAYAGNVEWSMLVPQKGVGTGHTHAGTVKAGLIKYTWEWVPDWVFMAELRGQNIYFNNQWVGWAAADSWVKLNVMFDAEARRCYVYVNNTLVINGMSLLTDKIPDAFHFETSYDQESYYSALDDFVVTASRISRSKAECIYYSTKQQSTDMLFRINNTIWSDPISGAVYKTYPATYDFASGLPSISHPGVWVEDREGASQVVYKPYLGSHQHVLEFSDLDTSPAWAQLAFPEQKTEGGVAFWLQASDAAKPFFVQFYSDGGSTSTRRPKSLTRSASFMLPLGVAPRMSI